MRDGGARPAANRPATEHTVADPAEREHRRAAYRARERTAAERDMDRYIEQTYGIDWVRRSRS